MRNPFSTATLDAIAAVLPAPGDAAIDGGEVHRRIGCWARGTIRIALIDLERMGRATSVCVPYPGGFRKLWNGSQQAVEPT